MCLYFPQENMKKMKFDDMVHFRSLRYNIKKKALYTYSEEECFMKAKPLTKDFFWVGNLDPDLRIFDIIMHTEFGTTYNSYLLKGSEKTALFETSKVKYFEEYLEKVTELVPIEKIDYLILDHTENPIMRGL